MSKEITLEQYSAYLPYQVKMTDGIHPPYTLYPSMLVDSWNLQHKMMLRSLDDIFKPITDEKGKSFIIAKLLWSINADEEEAFDLYGVIPEYWQININELRNSPYSFNYYDIIRLCQYHFDVFGLISQDKAIKL